MSETETPAAEVVGGAPAEPVKKGKALPVKLLRGYRPLDAGKKLPAGEIVKLPADEARKIVAANIAERADEF